MVLYLNPKQYPFLDSESLSNTLAYFLAHSLAHFITQLPTPTFTDCSAHSLASTFSTYHPPPLCHSQLTSFPLHSTTKGGIHALLIANDDDGTVITGGYDAAIHVLSTRQQQVLASLTSHSKKVTSLAFAGPADRRHVLSGSADSTVRLWRAGSWEEVEVGQQHVGEVVRVVGHPTGGHFLSAGRDGFWCFYDLEVGMTGDVAAWGYVVFVCFVVGTHILCRKGLTARIMSCVEEDMRYACEVHICCSRRYSTHMQDTVVVVVLLR